MWVNETECFTRDRSCNDWKKEERKHVWMYEGVGMKELHGKEIVKLANDKLNNGDVESK